MKNPPMQVPDGVLLVRKPKGWSSFDVVRKVKKMVRPKKLGHTGTLDPMATGLLPLVVGEATKLTHYPIDGKKRYKARARLGTGTDTLDAEGKETSRMPVPGFDDTSLKFLLEKFTGQIEQVPPMYSAVHHKGKRLYELARRGEEVERKIRQVSIYSLEFTSYGPDFLELDVTCSAGTYIRTLAYDMARELGTTGHLDSLQRTEVGTWKIEDALELQGLDKSAIIANIIPLEGALSTYRHVAVDDRLSTRLSQGNRLTQEELNKLGLTMSNSEQIVWFSSSSTSPIVLSKLAPVGTQPAMEILRVLRPEK